MQTLRDQRVHHKIGRLQRTVHQRPTVHRGQRTVHFVAHSQYLQFKISEYKNLPPRKKWE